MLINVDLSYEAGDLAAEAEQVQNLRRGFEQNGFLTLTGHGISSERKAEMLEISKAFFLNAEQKQATDLEQSPLGRGYEKPTNYEYKESFMTGLELDPQHPYVQAELPFHGANQWPIEQEGLAGFKDKMLSYQADMLAITAKVNRLLSLSLGQDAETINDRVTVPHCMLRLLRYQGHNQQENGIAPHTDWGCLSLIIQDENAGLEILDKAGEWQLVVPEKDQMVVNVGNIAEILSGGHYPSTLHRVAGNLNHDRYSIAFFCDLDYFSSLKPLTTLKQGWHRYEQELDRPCLDDLAKMTVADYVCLMHERDFGLTVERPTLSERQIGQIQNMAKQRIGKNVQGQRPRSALRWNIS